ncbi:protein FAM184B isoform X2 [Trichomycterus rosablanca]|uniref:protein FAM184B isoform X2 n=1 Tax=Trichomycterus rosablanca TaxID=2290929 RepID=UPI002F358476
MASSLLPEACNGTAPDPPGADQEHHDYQMHTKMCKKIAQLTKVIYSLNTKNEEQEATLQTLLRATTEASGNLQPAASQDERGEDSALALRTRLLELQTTVEEVEEREQRAELEHAEQVAALTQEAADLRRSYHTSEMERDKQCRLLRQIQEEKRALEEECQSLRRVREEDRTRAEQEDRRRNVEEELRREREDWKKAEDEWERRWDAAREALAVLKEEKRQAEETWKAERDDLRRNLKVLKEERRQAEETWKVERDDLRRNLKVLKEERRQAEETWKADRDELRRNLKVLEEERRTEQEVARTTLQENCKAQNSLLLQRLRKAEAELEVREERLVESSRHSAKLQARVEDLEEQLENGSGRVAEAERVARKAEEELMVAKERLLLQENELQSKSEELLSQSSSQVKVSVEVEELRSQLGRLNIRNKELELQNSGRSNDHARMLKQHADALSSMRLELQRAHAEEIKRLHQEVEKERRSIRQELEEERKQVHRTAEEEKVRLKDKLRKALEELNRRHANELHQARAAADGEKNQAEENLKTSEEDRRNLEAEKVELNKQLQQSLLKISELEAAIQLLEREKEEARRREEENQRVGLQSPSASELEGLREELERERHDAQSMQENFALEKDHLQAEISALKNERDVLQQTNHSAEERLRLQLEKHFSDHLADLQKDRERELGDVNLRWRERVEELESQLEEKRALFSKSQEERERDDHHANGEMRRMKLEIQKTRETNSSLRAQLHATIQEKERLMKKQQLQAVQEEDEDGGDVEGGGRTPRRDVEGGGRTPRALQDLESRAGEELQAERQHLHTQYKLQLAEGGAYPAAHRVGAAGHPEAHAADRGPAERTQDPHRDDGAAAGPEAAEPRAVAGEAAGREEQRGPGAEEGDRGAPGAGRRPRRPEGGAEEPRARRRQVSRVPEGRGGRRGGREERRDPGGTGRGEEGTPGGAPERLRFQLQPGPATGSPRRLGNKAERAGGEG